MKSLLCLEFNELNFEAIEFYAERGDLPTFKQFLCRHGYCSTSSEFSYLYWEPWIQWVTAHTGLSYSEHQVFRLGDIIYNDITQIWERLETLGFRVGAFSPMNAKLRMLLPAFFIPDPWTSSDIYSAPSVKRFYKAICYLVENRGDFNTPLRIIIDFIIGWIHFANPLNYPTYLSLLLSGYFNRWKRPLFLDLLLADMFIYKIANTQPHFASLFLNASAHIQHHYLFSSASYQGNITNPSWYIRRSCDPVLDSYKLYDMILQRIQICFPQSRIIIVTALHQDPNDKITFYWRPKNHVNFLKALGIPFRHVKPRMSRDFLLICSDKIEAQSAQNLLQLAQASDGAPLFEADNRGSNLFVSFIYEDDIDDSLEYSIGGTKIGYLREQVAFVAIKNGKHNGIGYYADSGKSESNRKASFPLRFVPDRIIEAMNEVHLEI